MKKAGIITGSLFVLFGVVPAFYRVFNTGSITLTLAGLLVLLLTLRWNGIPRVLRIASTVFLCICFSVAAIVSAFMARQAWLNPPPEGEDLPAIVLGGRVYEYGPSLIVAYRLNAAAVYLLRNPQAVCVVSGGKGRDEPASEASVMAEYLISKHGVDPGRIIIEDKSSNTLENIRFSKSLLDGETSAVIVTDSFHQLRAGIFAKSEGLTAYGVSSFTPPGLLPAYWVRDIMGVLHTVIIAKV